MRIALFALVLLASLSARADYDKTKWGMTLPEVESLYPGAVSARAQNGRATLSVVRPVAALTTALVIFTFDARGLIAVDILFPRQGSVVNLATGEYSAPTVSEGRAIFDAAYRALVSKYGKASAAAKGNGGKMWRLGESDWIYLGVSFRGDGVDTRATVGIEYGHTTEDAKSDGL